MATHEERGFDSMIHIERTFELFNLDDDYSQMQYHHTVFTWQEAEQWQASHKNRCYTERINIISRVNEVSLKSMGC